MPRLIALAVCVATFSFVGRANAQQYGQVVTIGPWESTPVGWAPRFGTYYNPYVSSYPAAYGYGYDGYYGGLYDPTARELRRIRYAIEDATYRPFPPLRPAFRPGPRPSGFDLPSRRGRR